MVGLPIRVYPFGIFIFAVFLIIFIACAAGSVVGARTKTQEDSRACLMPLLIPMILFSGYVIPYRQLSWIWRPIYFVSPMQWCMSLLEHSIYKGLTFVDCDPATQ